jgi:hypothetical protein
MTVPGVVDGHHPAQVHLAGLGVDLDDRHVRADRNVGRAGLAAQAGGAELSTDLRILSSVERDKDQPTGSLAQAAAASWGEAMPKSVPRSAVSCTSSACSSVSETSI